MTNRDSLTPLSAMKDYRVADDDPDVRGWTVVGSAGERLGTVRDLMIDPARMKAEYLSIDGDAGQNVMVPTASAELDESRHQVRVNIALGASDAATPQQSAMRNGPDRPGPFGNARLTRAEEELRVGAREVEAGEVVIGKHVESERITEDVPVTRERVRVERRPVAEEEMRGSAEIGSNEIRIPVAEEKLVVEKRPVVKEELVISKERATETERLDTDVRKEKFDVSGDANLVNDETRRRGGR